VLSDVPDLVLFLPQLAFRDSRGDPLILRYGAFFVVGNVSKWLLCRAVFLDFVMGRTSVRLPITFLVFAERLVGTTDSKTSCEASILRETFKFRPLIDMSKVSSWSLV
jgi:hypothetical protein